MKSVGTQRRARMSQTPGPVSDHELAYDHEPDFSDDSDDSFHFSTAEDSDDSE